MIFIKRMFSSSSSRREVRLSPISAFINRSGRSSAHEHPTSARMLEDATCKLTPARDNLVCIGQRLQINRQLVVLVHCRNGKAAGRQVEQSCQSRVAVRDALIERLSWSSNHRLFISHISARKYRKQAVLQRTMIKPSIGRPVPVHSEVACQRASHR